MNSAGVLAHIESIAAFPGNIDKQTRLVEGMKNDLFKRVCLFAYDPFRTYGVRQMPIGKAHDGFKDFDADTWAILDKLIKRELTGNAARDAITSEIDCLFSGSAELFRRIIRKDLRAGFSESSINKAYAGLIEEFPYMRCSLPKNVDLDLWPWERGVPSQEKADGMYGNADHEEGGLVSIRTRQGNEFPMDKFADIEAEIRTTLAPGFQQHGEFVVIRDGVVCDRKTGNGIMNHVLSGGDFAPNEKPKYLIWDQIPLSAVKPKGKFDKKYILRLAALAAQLKNATAGHIALIPTRIVKSKAAAYAHAVELMKLGKEGTVIKHPDGTWRDGTSKDQIKLKLEFTVDLQIKAVVPGKAGKKTEGRAGSLTCESSDGLLRTDVTVKNEAMRDSIDAFPDRWIGGVIAVTANDIMEPGESNSLHSLFLPRMAETHVTGKTEADSLQRIIDQKQAAIFGEQLLKEAA